MTLAQKMRRAIRAGCNTAQDLADVTGRSRRDCSNYVQSLLEQGFIRRTGRKITGKLGRGRKLVVFERVRWGR